MRNPLAIGRTIKNVNRAREILGVLVRYGFDNVLQEVGLDRVLLRWRKLVGKARADETVTRLPLAVRLRRAMEDLGPTFVKLGQVLSMRPDLVPPSWAEEFARLQDEVAPVEFEQIQARLREELGEDVEKLFESIEEEPLAAASLSQVHRATLRGGGKVVLKVLRPDSRRRIDSDMDILRYLAEFAEEHFADLGYSPTEVVEQFSREITREVDLLREARATELMRAAFEGNDKVHFPRVHWEATTHNVLTMEEIMGRRLSRLDPEDLPEAERHAIVANGTDAILRQCLEIGFFHADPHPGNIFVLEDGAVCFIDCGMTGQIDPDSAGLLADLVHGVVSSDLNRVIDVVITMGDADPALAENRAFRADTWEFISRFEAGTFEQLDIGELLGDFFERVRRHNLRCPADIVFLIKAITTIQGVGNRLLPSFDLATHVQPYIERLVRKRYGIRAMRGRIEHGMQGYAELLETVPRHVRSLMFSLRRNKLTMNLEHRGLERLTNTIDRASGNIANSVLVGSILMGSSILILADSVLDRSGVLTIVAGAGFAMALFLIVIRLVANRFD